ncbi:hypothetical protein [Flavipsychrobacter stenotrophus]|uniref:hypothetical protein n=1 Tax=Flavipsychrobacter stenotrophus TaxID=2077091 RepID=UPI0013750512|nr:hypothetical protein [Flavipsychrobacter stenotrophus]
MSELHKGLSGIGAKVEPKEGERLQKPLCSNKANVRSPSLDFISNSPLVTEDMQIDYLAKLLVDIFMELKCNGKPIPKKGCDILPGIN